MVKHAEGRKQRQVPHLLLSGRRTLGGPADDAAARTGSGAGFATLLIGVVAASGVAGCASLAGWEVSELFSKRVAACVARCDIQGRRCVGPTRRMLRYGDERGF